MVLTNYIDKNSYFQDMRAIDERLTNLEHTVDNITKNLVELLQVFRKQSN